MIKTTTPRPEPTKITVALHHTAVSRTRQNLQYTSVNNFHKSKNWGTAANPWYQPAPSSLGKYGGYNVFCEQTGDRQWYRRYGEETIAQRGNNCVSLGNCSVISYCMAGDFRVEKPTTFQVRDFQLFVDELKAAYPNAEIAIQQHNELDTNRTCAELPKTDVSNWFLDEGTTKDATIAALRAELGKLKKDYKQLMGIVTALIKIITK